MHSDNILVETYTSTKDARTKNNNKIIEINVCLIISNFIFSLLLPSHKHISQPYSSRGSAFLFLHPQSEA